MGYVQKVVKKIIWGTFLIAAGTLLLLSNHDLISISFSFKKDWPVIFIIFGLSELLDGID